MSASEPDAGKDEAWVTIETRTQLADVRRFCASIERLFRINPYLQFRSWAPQGADTYRVDLHNLSNGCDQRLAIRVACAQDELIRLDYDEGLKRSTAIEFESTESGSRVRITDDYSALAASDRTARLAEVDHSLTAWGHALRGYLQRESYLGRFWPWHWFLDRVWLPMNPSARRICSVIAWITLAELVLAVLVAAVYWLEVAGSS